MKLTDEQIVKIALETRSAEPVRREWRRLTDEEISAVDWKANETLHDFARAIEAAVLAQGEPLFSKQAFCYCDKDVSLQMVSGGGAPEGYLGRATLRIGDQYRDYYTHPAPVNTALLEALKLASVMLKTGSPEYDERDAIEVIDAAIAAVEGKA